MLVSGSAMFDSNIARLDSSIALLDLNIARLGLNIVCLSLNIALLDLNIARPRGCLDFNFDRFVIEDVGRTGLATKTEDFIIISKM